MPTTDPASAIKAAGNAATALESQIKPLDSQARTAIRELQDAAKKKDFETSDLKRKLLQLKREEALGAKDDLAELNADVMALEDDKLVLEQRQADLTRLTKRLGDMRKTLDRLLADIDGALASTKEMFDRRQSEAFGIYRNNERLVVTLLNDIDAAQSAVATSSKRAQACAKSGDRAGLAAAQAALADQVRRDVPALERRLDQLEAVVRDYVKTYSPDGRWSGLKAIGKNIAKLREDILLARKGLDTARRQIYEAARLQPGPPDVDKAAKVLRLERYKDQLRRALDERSERMEGALDKLAKVAGLGETGRDLLRKLGRSGLV